MSKSEQHSPGEGAHEAIGKHIGKIVDKKQIAYGNSFGVTKRLWEIRLERYDDGTGHYRIPHALLSHMLELVRIDDKIMRIVANPDGDLMNENPKQDIAGYALLGMCADMDKERVDAFAGIDLEEPPDETPYELATAAARVPPSGVPRCG